MSDLKGQIHSIARRIVSDHFSREAPFLDRLWNVFWQRLKCDRIEDLPELPWWDTRTASTQALGILGDSGGKALDSLYVIGSLVGAAIVLLQEGRDALLDASKVRDVLLSEAARMDAPARVRDVLGRYATGLLAEQFSVVDWKPEVPQIVERTGVGKDDATRTTPIDSCYVERLTNSGRHFPPKVYPQGIGRRIGKQGHYDILVDEIQHEVRVATSSSTRPQKTHEIPRMQRGMLWLVLTNLGGYIEHQRIIQLFNLVSDGPETIYPYRKLLKDLLGEDLRDRVIEQGVSKKYPVPAQGWSFYWIRQTWDASSSELLEGLIRPSDNQ